MPHSRVGLITDFDKISSRSLQETNLRAYVAQEVDKWIYLFYFIDLRSRFEYEIFLQILKFRPKLVLMISVG